MQKAVLSYNYFIFIKANFPLHIFVCGLPEFLWKFILTLIMYNTVISI